MKRYRFMALWAWTAIILTAATAQATLITQGYYGLGEDDSISGTTTIDKSANSRTMTKSGTMSYTTDVANSAKTATGSTKSMSFSNGCLLRGPAYAGSEDDWTSAIDNFGAEGWFKTTDTSAHQVLFNNGSFGCSNDGKDFGSGFALCINRDPDQTSNSRLYGLFGGVAWLDTGITLSNNTWFYAAIVRNAGTTTAYFKNDGDSSLTSVVIDTTHTPVAATNGLSTISSAYGLANGWLTAGNYEFLNGSADSVRAFTFSSGGFTTSDLLINQTVPEPSAMALVVAGMFGLLAYVWRKRR